MHNHKNSFVVIDIYKEMDPNNIKFVKALKLNKSLYQTFVDIIYFYLTCYFTTVKTSFQKFYEYTYLEIRSFHHNQLIFKRKYINELIIYDTGICIYIGNEKLNIPYENIMQFYIDVKKDLLGLLVLGKIIINENSVILETNTEISEIYLFMNNNISNVQNCFNNIKKYLYYHLKYNEFNYNIVDYYNKMRIKTG
jgi:hypothetical protein